jgi:hypothetical protein
MTLTVIPELTSLYLGGNQIQEVTSGIRGLRKLKFLYLGGNLLRRLPKEICQLEKLQALFLCFNQVPEPGLLWSATPLASPPPRPSFFLLLFSCPPPG